MMNDTLTDFDFSTLVKAIQQTHEQMAAQVGRAVNAGLTLRNWLIGAYIAEYELSGADRASYGDNLLNELSRALRRHKISSVGNRQLYNYLAFYKVYPQIVGTVSLQNRQLLPKTMDFEKLRTVSAKLKVSPDKIVNNLSYSHFELLTSLGHDLHVHSTKLNASGATGRFGS